MKITFIRNTHDANGQYLGDNYFKLIKPEDELPFGVHSWNGREKLTFDELYQRIIDDFKYGAAEHSIDVTKDEFKHNMPSVPILLRSLANMIEGKLIVCEVDYQLGYVDGDCCNRTIAYGKKCNGIINFHLVENCYCHISPPCSACTSSKAYCPECGWEENEGN